MKQNKQDLRKSTELQTNREHFNIYINHEAHVALQLVPYRIVLKY